MALQAKSVVRATMTSTGFNMPRCALAVAIGAAHVLVLWLLGRSIGYAVPGSAAPGMLVIVSTQPRIREAGDTVEGPDLQMLNLRLDPHLPQLQIELPEIDFSVERNEGASSVAPTLQGSPSRDVASYAQQAALSPGEGATVVLLIEVLESGDPGRIEIDTSSGSRQVDQAAMDYARTRHWYAGRLNGQAHPTWIRWGVRLQA
jgi:TonB family protein